MFRSPLMMGGDLLSMDAWTESLLTNPEVIEVNQHSREGRAEITTKDTAVWVAWPDGQNKDGKGYYLGVFNIGDAERTVHYEWKELGLAEGKYKVRDLWERKELGKAESLTVKLAGHASVLWRVSGGK
jgi:hypothetical protein